LLKFLVVCCDDCAIVVLVAVMGHSECKEWMKEWMNDRANEMRGMNWPKGSMMDERARVGERKELRFDMITEREEGKKRKTRENHAA
jgi:hypothetical protein